MRLTLRQLQIFCAVAETGSTTAASTALALSQSATSAALNELEDALGAVLFDRVGKRLLINDNGRLLLEQSRHMLSMARTMEGQFSGGTADRDMRIGASMTIGAYMLPALLADYSRQYGDIVPRVAIANTQAVANAVANFEVEIGFIEGPCHVRELRVEPWIKDELIIVAAPGHELGFRSSRQKITPAKLAGARWLLREPGSGTREAVEDALLPHLHYLEEGGEFSSSDAIKHACAAGLGLACMSRSAVADLIALGRLAEVNTTLPKLSRTLYMVYSRKKTLSTALKTFRNFCGGWTPH